MCGKDGSGNLSTQLGTENYKAPEIVAGASYNGAAADLFAGAVLLFILVLGSPPFRRAEKQDQHYRFLLFNRSEIFWKIW